jgi:hypothetical protein
LDIEDAIRGICDSGDLLMEVLTYEDCNDAQSASNNYQIYAIVTFLFSLYCFYDAKKINDKREKNDNLPHVHVQTTKPEHHVQIQNGENVAGQIEKLGELKDKGLLTDDLFQQFRFFVLKFFIGQ